MLVKITKKYMLSMYLFKLCKHTLLYLIPSLAENSLIFLARVLLYLRKGQMTFPQF